MIPEHSQPDRSQKNHNSTEQNDRQKQGPGPAAFGPGWLSTPAKRNQKPKQNSHQGKAAGGHDPRMESFRKISPFQRIAFNNQGKHGFRQ
jgi:hypothetical protein